MEAGCRTWLGSNGRTSISLEQSITFIQRKIEGKTPKALVNIRLPPGFRGILLSRPICALPSAPVFPELHDKPGSGQKRLINGVQADHGQSGYCGRA